MSGEPLLDLQRAVGDDTGWLPLWAIDAQVLEYARGRKEDPGDTPASFSRGPQQRIRGDKLVPSEIAGSALPLVYKATFLLWSFFFIFPAIVWHFTPCELPDMPYSLQTSPLWLYCFFAPVVVAAMWMEWKCLRIVILSQVQWTGPFSVCGMTPSYTVWLFAMALYSMLSHADVVSQNMVVVGFVKILWACPHGQTNLYQSLALLAAITWVSMPLQLVWTVIFATPAQKIDYDIGMTDAQQHGFQTRGAQLFGESCWKRRWSNDTLDCYVIVNRMVSVSFQSKYQAIQSARWFLTSDLGTTELVGATKDFFWRFLPIVETEVHRFLFSSLQNLAKLELQVSILALELQIKEDFEEKAVNWHIQLPVAIGILTASLSVAQAARLWTRIRSEGNLAKMRVASNPQWKIHSGSVTTFEKYLKLFAALIAVYATVLLHACINFLAAYLCPDTLWNLSGCIYVS